MLGLAPDGFDPARGAPTQREIGRALEHAAETADSGSALSRLADGYLAAYRAELGLDSRISPGWLRGTSLTVGYARQKGAFRPGWGYEDGDFYGDWNDAVPLADETGGRLGAAVQVTPASWLAFRSSVSAGARENQVMEAYAAAGVGAFAMWAGRRRLDWSAGPGDGLIVNDRAFDGLGFLTVRGLHLPGLLRHAGRVQAEVSIARVDLERSCTDPTIADDSVRCLGAWFAVTRGSLTPHDRFQIGVTRGVLFGGEGNTEVDAFGLFSILIGKHAGEASELDNQVVAVDASWRVPTERWLPLRAYMEWGFEDSAGAWRNVPGILAGVEMPMLPGLTGVGIALERASFARSCCGNPIWYRNSVFHDGWVIDGRPLGHELGGHGSEWALRARWDGFDPRHAFEFAGFVRQRDFENLYAETRIGSSVGMEARIDLNLMSWLQGVVAVEAEDGEDWRRTGAALSLRALL